MSHGYVHPRFGNFGQGFVVLAQPSAPAQPGQSPLHHPSPGQHLKAGSSGTPHYLQGPTRQRPHPANQLSGVSAISPNQAEAGNPASQLADDQPGSVPVLDISRVHGHGQQQAQSVYDDMALPSEDLLAGIVAARPPFSVVFTLWLSMMAALGAAYLPSASRTMGRSASWTRSQLPSADHRRKYLYKVCQGGRS